MQGQISLLHKIDYQLHDLFQLLRNHGSFVHAALESHHCHKNIGTILMKKVQQLSIIEVV